MHSPPLYWVLQVEEGTMASSYQLGPLKSKECHPPRPLPPPHFLGTPFPSTFQQLDAGKRRARCRSMLRHLTIMPSCPSALQVGYQRIMRMLLSIQLVSYFLRVSLTVHLLCRGALLKRKLKRRKIFVMTSQSLIFADVEMEEIGHQVFGSQQCVNLAVSLALSLD